MRTIRTEREIDAPPAAVWAALTDLAGYETWNPHVVAASGDLREGGRLDIRVDGGEDRPRELAVEVTALEPVRRLEWVGHAVHPRLFEGRHTFELEALAGNRTRLVNRERLTGMLVPLVVRQDASEDYAAMNEALAARVERRAAVAED